MLRKVKKIIVRPEDLPLFGRARRHHEQKLSQYLGEVFRGRNRPLKMKEAGKPRFPLPWLKKSMEGFFRILLQRDGGIYGPVDTHWGIVRIDGGRPWNGVSRCQGKGLDGNAHFHGTLKMFVVHY